MVKLVFKVGLLSALGLGVGAVSQKDRLDGCPWWSSLTIVRFGRAAYASLKISVDYKLHYPGISATSAEDVKIKSEIHTRSAELLKEMCWKNGGLFIKLGQHIGAMEYLLPSEYVKSFKVFHNKAPSTPLDKLKKVIEEELDRPIEEIFSHFDLEPLGAASIAQCHKGKLKDGTAVAVKIQHPDVKKNAYTDMEIVDFLVECVKWVFPDFQFTWLAKEVRTNLPNELNFLCEVENMKKFSKAYQHLNFVKVPFVHEDLTTPRVLVMEFCEGEKISNNSYIEQNRIPVNEISHQLSKLYSEMIFTVGLVHCDPHPGNVLVRKNKSGKVETVLLDHGLYIQLPDRFRVTYCRLWESLIKKDASGIKKYCLELNADKLYPLLACMVTARSWESIQSGIQSVDRSEAENDLIRREILTYFSEISHLLNSVPRQLLLILKTNDLLRSLEHSLGTSDHSHSYLTMSKHCIRAICDHEEKKMQRWHCRAVRRTRMFLGVFFISLYEWWLWIRYSFVHM